MSRQNSYRLSAIYQAILATALSAVALSAHAVNLSQADIQSAQHEPLSATINVSNIDANNFNAKLAPNSVYQQMGLTQNMNIQVQFTATSDTTGRITLSSSMPISTPFTDVVLSLDNNGEQVVKPQTLLMPVSTNNIIPNDLVKPLMVASQEEQNLPIASNLTVLPINHDEMNHKLAQTQDDTSLDLQDDASSHAEKHTADTPSVTSNIIIEPKLISQEEKVISTITPEGSNKQLEILTEQITRRVYPAGEAPQPPTNFSQNHTQDFSSQEIQVSDTTTPETSASETQSTTGAIYVVQSGDSLWGIANEIAKANQIDVSDVMKSLFNQNPDAFINGKINQLKTNANLSMPNYEVIPSQKAISEAIASSSKAKSARQQSTTAKNQRTNIRTSDNKAQMRKSTEHTLPKPQVTLITPSQTGQATGSQTRTNAPNNTAGGGEDLVASLKSTRSKTANNAQRVSNLNQELSNATQKLQLQNKKLAELEERLKALKDKK